jgi:DNA-binding transcriptional LysR family regulator
MHYTLQQLRIFSLIVENKSLRKSAEKMFLTPPALTKQLHNLEEIIGLELFKRKNKKLHLTDNGKVFYDLIHPLLNRFDEINHLEIPSLISSQLDIKIAISQIFEQNIFNKISTVIESGLVFNYDLHVDSKDSLINKLLNYDIDVALMVLNDEEREYLISQGFNVRLYHTIKFNAYVSKKLISKYQSFDDLFTNSKLIIESKHVSNFTGINILHFSSCLSVLNAVIQSIGYGFLPTVLLRENDKNGLININDKIDYSLDSIFSYYVYRTKEKPKSKLIEQIFS